jgi:hypothetical protein
MRNTRVSVPVMALGVVALALSIGCGGGLAGGRSDQAEGWLGRASKAYKSGDWDDANDAVGSLLKASPKDPEARILGARLALARLDYNEAVKLTEGLDGSDAKGIRGRAYWFLGDLEQAADNLEAMLADPNVKDPWAKDVARLARQGSGRHPFSTDGAIVASVSMPPAGPVAVIPCELDGENVLALLATASSEVMVDSTTRKDPAWVNLRFDRLEVHDVPALPMDLSGMSRQLGAPIKALIGMNFLRHLHATFDRRGDQFIVRRDEPVPPPGASRITPWYARGGAWMVSLSVSPKTNDKSLFIADSSALLPVALSDAAWKRAGVSPADLRADPNAPANMKSGIVPAVRFGTFDLPRVAGVSGVETGKLADELDADVAGIAGSGFLSIFRITFADKGKTIWIEPDPVMDGSGAPPREGPSSQPQAPPSAPAKEVLPAKEPPPAKPGTPAAPKGSANPPKPTGAPAKGNTK